MPLRWVLIHDPHEEFETQALLCTDLDAEPERIISWFVRRWQIEATFQEVRQHLGFETQRHWAERAIRRTAPALLSLFSLVTLFANQRMANKNLDTAPPSGVVRQGAPDLLRCFGAGEEGAVGTRRGDFLRVGAGKRDGKSPAGVHGKANRRGLLCSVMAKVELKTFP